MKKKNVQFEIEEISLMLVGVQTCDIYKQNSKWRAHVLEENPSVR